MTESVIAKIAKTTIAEGGGTFERNGELAKITLGYGVGVHNVGIVPVGDRDMLNAVLDVGEITLDYHPYTYLGTWLEKGEIHVDLTKLVMSKKRAIKLARELGELAIWDFANNTEIFV